MTPSIVERRANRLEPLAPPCSFGTSLPLAIPVLLRGSKRQQRGGTSRLVSVCARIILASFCNEYAIDSKPWVTMVPHVTGGAGRSNVLNRRERSLFNHERSLLSVSCCGGQYQLIPVIMRVLQTNSWKPIKATYYEITSPLSQ